MRKFILISLLTITSVCFAQHGGGRGGMSQRQMDPNKVPKIGIVHGTVVDSSTGMPIPYASVAIVNVRSSTIMTGGITNENGEFEVKEIPLGRHKVVVEYIGFKKQELGPFTFMPFGGNKTKYDLETIQLSQTTLQMAGIDVEGDRPLFVQTAEKRIFSVEKNSLSSGGTAIDALRQVPGVEVDPDDNISLRGSTKVNIMIDGKPSIMAGGDIKMLLQSMASANIADIEVMTNPGAKYDPEGMAGIINIVLKENKFAGLNGNVNSSGDSQGGTNLSSQVNWRTTTFNTYINLGLRNGVRESSGDSYRKMTFPTYENVLNQISAGQRGGGSVLAKTGFEYFMDSKQSISLSASFSNGDRLRDNKVNTIETGPGEMRYLRTTDGNNKWGDFALALSYDRKYDNPKQKLSSFMRYSDGLNDGENEFWTTPDPGYEEVVRVNRALSGQDGENTNFEFKTDYVHPFDDDSKLEVGVNSTIKKRGDTQLAYIYDDAKKDFVTDPDYDNAFNYNEDVHAAYIQYGGSLGMFGVNVGGRYEMVTMLSELKSTNESFKNPYNSFYPSLSISVGAPQLLQIQASYSKRVRRPRSRMLNPFTSREDARNIRKGNPFLKPEYTDSYELNFGRYSKGLSLSLGGYYRHTTDKMQRHKIVDEDGVSTATYANIDEQKTQGIEYSVVGSLGRKFRIMFSGSIYKDEINSALYGEEYDKTATGQRMRFTAMWNMNSTTEFMFFMFYMPGRDIPIGRMGSMNHSSVSIKKKFMDERLNLTLNMGDPFNLSGFKFETWGDNWYQESNRNWNSQTVRLTLEYRFGKMEDRSRYSRQRGSRGEGMEMESMEIQ
ncbi:MAG: TonB-dependent receptor [Candidatus Marinimicrobia bacterium]|jgi:outer membrane receptor protein involved in Fe transport|nr:TonB-dependent receptor [Candidatus Neomarinimicrobiota bacterium]MBT6129583.1 TonB-dependent receptor [Candidatus Neomarinimicrobiota bacterium]